LWTPDSYSIRFLNTLPLIDITQRSLARQL
jgi:hypothetical protein